MSVFFFLFFFSFVFFFIFFFSSVFSSCFISFFFFVFFVFSLSFFFFFFFFVFFCLHPLPLLLICSSSSSATKSCTLPSVQAPCVPVVSICCSVVNFWTTSCRPSALAFSNACVASRFAVAAWSVAVCTGRSLGRFRPRPAQTCSSHLPQLFL